MEVSPEEVSPEEASPVEASPVEASPEEASPEESSPVEASPVEASPEEAATAAPTVQAVGDRLAILKEPAQAQDNLWLPQTIITPRACQVTE